VNPVASWNDWQFSTKRRDGVAEVVLYEYRGYDVRTGRWPNRDPLGEPGFAVTYSSTHGTKQKAGFAEVVEGANLYGFVHDNPVSIVDIDGRTGWGPPFFPPPRPPAPPTPFESCVTRCIDANGGGWALAALGISTVGGGTVPKPFGAGALGGSCCTTVPSLIQHYTGLGLRQLARRLNPVMTAAQCAAAGYLLGATTSCAVICGSDNDAY